jgi:hypothetical protein
MVYPCIPIWMKERQKDPFDYPLRSKKEVLLENELVPPCFNISVLGRIQGSSLYCHGSTLNEVDTREKRLKFIADFDDMNLTPLQKKRMIFLLGRRYRNDNKLRITVKQYNDAHYNYARGVDIIKQLYYEAKRAPLFIWEKMYNRERRYFKRKFIGKTQEELEQGFAEAQKWGEEEVAKFEELWKDQSNFTEEKIKERYEKKLQSNVQTMQESKSESSSQHLEGIATKEEYYKGLVKDRVLSPKAYKTFFENELKTEK